MSAKAADYHKRLTEFMVEQVFPAEKSYDEYRASVGPNDFTVPPVVEEPPPPVVDENAVKPPPPKPLTSPAAHRPGKTWPSPVMSFNSAISFWPTLVKNSVPRA